MATHSILITDHDKALSDLVSRALSRDGYEVRVLHLRRRLSSVHQHFDLSSLSSIPLCQTSQA